MEQIGVEWKRYEAGKRDRMEQIGGENGKDMRQERRQEKRGTEGRKIEQFGNERKNKDEDRMERIWCNKE
jgi:hypothetical protein